MTVAITDLTIGTVNKQLTSFSSGCFSRLVDCIGLSIRNTGYTLGAFTLPSPVFAMWNHMDVFVISHS